MEEKIFPNVEYLYGSNIPSKPFMRKTQKLYLKTNDEGITLLGKTYLWSEIKSVSLKYFNSNPYIQLDVSGNTKHSFYFESKFYYRKKAPWFGGSEFLTKEFVKLLEEKEIFTLEELEKEIKTNTQSILIHTIWNSFFWIFPPAIFILIIMILLLGFNAT